MLKNIYHPLIKHWINHKDYEAIYHFYIIIFTLGIFTGVSLTLLITGNLI